MPKLDFVSHATPSLYAYPAPIEEKKGREVEKVETAILSITARSKAKEKKRAMSASTEQSSATAKPEEKMDVVRTFSFNYLAK